MSISAILRWTLIAIMLLLGGAFVIGGARLALLGGSIWYLISGAAIIVSAVLLIRCSRYGVWVYSAMLAATLVWTVAEVGFAPWGFLPRMLVLSIIGFFLLTPLIQSNLASKPAPVLPNLGWRASGAAAAAIVAISVGAIFVVSQPPQGGKASAAVTPAADQDWRAYGESPTAQRYSTLTQINAETVGRLEQVWTFRTGMDQKLMIKGADEATPIKIGGNLYTCTPGGEVIALEAATGKLIWRSADNANLETARSLICRGVSYARVAASGPCAERIYAGSAAARLRVLDAATGAACADFGQGGVIDLTQGLGEIPAGSYSVTSPPLMIEGVLVTGAAIADNDNIDMPSGVVRAFDLRSGVLKWAWDVGRPDNSGAPEANETYTRSTPNVWAPISADISLGLIYLPVGNPSPDHLGPTRRPFDEKFGSSIVAIEAATGKTRWSFQTVHHDIWDYDVPAQATLADIDFGGVRRAVLIQPTKQGEIFVLDRKTGEPVFPVTEIAAPQGGMPGEPVSPTQPKSSLSFAPKTLSDAEMWGMTPLDHLWCRIRLKESRFEGSYTPATTRPTISNPGFFGMMNWGGVSVDPVRQVMTVTTSNVPYIVRLIPSGELSNSGQHSAGTFATKGVPYGVSFGPLLSPLGAPCQQPPWGKLTSVDLKTGKAQWSRPVGTSQDSGPLGIKLRLPLPIGTPQIGGSIITAGGVIFSAGTLDNYLRAYDSQTGRELWRGRLPAGGQATPMTYAVNGRQYVVISAGGHAALGTDKGDSVVAFALPETSTP